MSEHKKIEDEEAETFIGCHICMRLLSDKVI